VPNRDWREEKHADEHRGQARPLHPILSLQLLMYRQPTASVVIGHCIALYYLTITKLTARALAVFIEAFSASDSGTQDGVGGWGVVGRGGWELSPRGKQVGTAQGGNRWTPHRGYRNLV
jgi:hypothetical protein